MVSYLEVFVSLLAYRSQLKPCLKGGQVMDFELVAIALGDFAWISLAFFLGFLARLINLPPLIGFLATG